MWGLIDGNKSGIYIFTLLSRPPFCSTYTNTHLFLPLPLVFFSFFCGGYNTYSGMQIVGWLLAGWVRGSWKDKGFSDGHIVVARKILMPLLTGQRMKRKKGNHCGIKRNIGPGNSAISCTKWALCSVKISMKAVHWGYPPLRPPTKVLTRRLLVCVENKSEALDLYMYETLSACSTLIIL